MNALLWTPSPNDDAVLWLCVKHPPLTLTGLARLLGKQVGTVCQNVQKLRSKGYLDRARGSLVPYPAAVERVRWLEQRGYGSKDRPWRHLPTATPASSARQDTEALGSVAVVPAGHPAKQTCTESSEGVPNDGAGVALATSMEPRGSIDLPPDALIDALAGFQDHLLQVANAQLRLRVTELEAEVAELRRRQELTLLRLGFAADALTGGG